MSFLAKAKNGLHYAFFDLLGGIGTWLIGGILLAGTITAIIPSEYIHSFLGSGVMSLVVMLIVSIPLYVCATGSTPIAAALALKGLSPGAALVFLMAGPATNLASITVISRILGKRATAVYVVTIASVTILLGMLTNFVYDHLGLNVTDWVTQPSASAGVWFNGVLAIALLLLIGLNWVRARRSKTTAQCCQPSQIIAPATQPCPADAPTPDRNRSKLP